MKSRFILISLIIVIIALAYSMLNGSTKLDSDDGLGAESESLIVLEPQSKSYFYSFNEGFMEISSTGAKFYNGKLERQWTLPLTIESPVSKQENDYVAVYERMGKIAKLFDIKGLVYEINANDAISNVSINANGYMSIITNSATRNRVLVYDNKGELLLERIDEDANFFPMDSAVSHDNKLLSIAFMDIDGVTLNPTILVLSLETKNMQSAIGDVLLSKVKEDLIVTDVKFIKSNQLICISDGEIFSLNISKDALSGFTGEIDGFSIPLTNEIFKGYITDTGSIIICYSSSFPSIGIENTLKEGTIRSYKPNGEIIFTHEFSLADYLAYACEKIVVGSGGKFICFDAKGNILFQYEAIGQVNQVLPTTSKNKALVVSSTEAKLLEVNNKETGNG